jgi:hypothetical protein
MSTIYLDASALAHWSNCREFYRREQVEKIETVKPSTYYHFGKATHLMVESFWRGESYEKALACAYDCLNEYPVGMLNPPELETWERMVKATPDVTAVYFENVSYSPEQLLWVEKEWSIPYGTTFDNSRNSIPLATNTQVILCGRMDRLMAGPRLVDVKTASEISQQGVPWKQQYRQDKVLDLQFALYDWYLQQMCKCGHDNPRHAGEGIGCLEIGCGCPKFQSMAPIEIYLEVLLKPYKSKAARYEKIPLNELITDSYRKRFRQQLAFKVSEIVHYHEHYLQQKPWPLAGGLACSSRYGTCAYQPICAWGESPKLMEKYKHREPHLELVKLAEAK